MQTLILWDIDHTLLDIGGLSGEIYATVFLDVTGRRLERLADMAGRTDRAIISETLSLHGITPSDDILTSFAEALAAAFAARNGEIRQRGRILPGAQDTLSALARRPDVVQSVLTGNTNPIAVDKLAAFGLHTLFDIEVGAYGFDGAERFLLVELARERAMGKYGETFDASTTVLVGDTPHDVLAAHEGGARVVAVATGASDTETLRLAGADVVLADLRDTDAVVRAALNAGSG